jgi:pyridoxal phosphate enzyme (YggS family)
MAMNKDSYNKIKNSTTQNNAVLVAVSKFKPIEEIQSLYDLGQRDFGENFVQELLLKYEALPKDIRWHFIGHLQSNKVKYIASFIQLIHGVDSEKLLSEINKQAAKNNRVIDCLLQVHIAEEETKYGFDSKELKQLTKKIKDESLYNNVMIRGLMGMASFSDDYKKVRNEFKNLKNLFEYTNDQYSTNNIHCSILSMGMSGDYEIALEEGSTMIRIGSLLFGDRNTHP